MTTTPDRACLLLAALLVASPTITESADTSAAGTTATGPALVVGQPVVVRGNATGVLSARDVLTSVDVLSGSVVARENVANSWELFGHLPGTMLTEFRQGTTSGKFSFRGFNGEGEINAVKLLIDGIPSNSNDGNMPYIDAIFPLDIASIEAVRGTNDARYGLHNIAGNANIATRIGGDYLTTRASYGSFASRDAQFAAGMENGGWSQNYFVGYRKSQGYRDHAEAEKASFAGKWFYGPEEGRYRVGLIARHYYIDAEEPGYLTARDSRTDPTRSYAFSATDGGEREVNQLSAHLDADLGNRLSLTTKAYLNRFDDQRWVKFSAGVSQQERDTNESHQGILSTLTYRAASTSTGSFSLQAGFNYERQQNTSLRFNTNQRIRQTQTRAQDFDFDNVGVYVQGVFEPTRQIKVIPAYRVDKVFGDFTNGLTGRTFAVNDYGLIQQPKLSVVYAPLDTMSFYGNWGKSFQVGVGAAAYKITRVDDLKPSINTGWEFGVKFTPVPWLDGRVALWRQVATDEARRKLNDPSNDSENIGRTRRQGIDLQFSARPTDQATLWAAYSRQYSRIVQAETSLPASQGKEIDHVPHYLFASGADFEVTPVLRVSAWVNAQGDYYLERTNSTGRFGRHFLVNLGAAYKAAKDLTLEFQVRNVTDQYYEYVWHDGTQSLHSPGDKRAFFGAATLNF